MQHHYGKEGIPWKIGVNRMNCRDESRESMSSHNTGVIRSVDTSLLFSTKCFDQKWEPQGTRPSNTSLRDREEEKVAKLWRRQ